MSGCSSLLGSMGPRAHTKYLGQAVGGILHARWVRNGLWSLERVIFGKKSPCLRGCSGGLFASNVTQMAVISVFHGSYESMRPKENVRHLAFADRGHAKCGMGPKQSLEWVLFGLKSPWLRGDQRHVLGLQCHSRGCNFWLEWLVWIDGTQGTYHISRFGDGGHARYSMMGPKMLLERVFFA